MERNKKRLKMQILTTALLGMLILGIIGVSFAWLSYWHRLNTISVLQIPSKISISGANRSEMQKISLEMTSDDTQDGDRVTIRRVFCIESTDDFLLEVAHTTNISNMDIKIFPVSNENSDKTSGTSGSVQGVDAEAGQVFYYNPEADALTGSYLNTNDNEIANNDLHDKTYVVPEDNNKVQKNAEPLYWLTNEAEDYDKTGYSRYGKAADGQTDIHYRYYVLQLSWEVRQAETDIVYLLASHKE